ncbi:Hypp4454 [Branchiostoma lanceolatum]|uniref:Hypp4454 protein n=1 Tax=Branchiostoma lanceolatum TaxID=7740 RepID=A0A8K0ADN9_BRALA|nr:Hypp4454 [Branchiostoma lanceolatum]
MTSPSHNITPNLCQPTTLPDLHCSVTMGEGGGRLDGSPVSLRPGSGPARRYTWPGSRLVKPRPSLRHASAVVLLVCGNKQQQQQPRHRGEESLGKQNNNNNNPDTTGRNPWVNKTTTTTTQTPQGGILGKGQQQQQVITTTTTGNLPAPRTRHTSPRRIMGTMRCNNLGRRPEEVRGKVPDVSGSPVRLGLTWAEPEELLCPQTDKILLTLSGATLCEKGQSLTGHVPRKNLGTQQHGGDLPSDPEQLTQVTVGEENLKVVPTFCYLGDMISQAGGCSDAVTARIKSAWKSFHELLPILTNRYIPLRNRGHVFNSCIRSVLLYASETWAVASEDIKRLDRSDNAMVRWICPRKLSETLSTKQLRAKLGVHSVQDVMRSKRLRWYGHLERMDRERWPKRIIGMTVEGRNPRGRPRRKWIDKIKEDLHHLNLHDADPQDRGTWRAATKLPHQHASTSNPQMMGTRRR